MPALKLWLFSSDKHCAMLFVVAVTVLVSACGSIKKTEKPVVKPDYNNTANNIHNT